MHEKIANYILWQQKMMLILKCNTQDKVYRTTGKYMNIRSRVSYSLSIILYGMKLLLNQNEISYKNGLKLINLQII